MLSKLIGALETIEEIKNQCRGYITVYGESGEMSVNLSKELFDKMIDTYTISEREEELWEKSSIVNGIRFYALYCFDELNTDDLLKVAGLKKGRRDMYTRLKKTLDVRNITIYRLAKMSKINTQDLYTALKGKKPLYPNWKKRIADALGTDVDSLFNEEEKGGSDGEV